MRKQSNDSPKVARDHSFAVEKKTQTFSFRNFPNNPLNDKVTETVNRMGGVGADAEHKYRKALAELSKTAKEATAIIAAEYEHMQADQYLDRWSLVQLLTDLNEPSTISALEHVVSSAIPPEKSEDPHSFSTVGEEVIIRTTAIEGITQLAASGDERAREILLKHATNENFSIKRAAIQGFLTYGGKDARELLLKTLPKQDHSILDIQRTDVRRVPQAQGGLHIVNLDKDELPPPDLGSLR
ncbi:hypothetical protein PAECIP111893_03917 [Paenibacillus plantiphilus]|uniref:HEAT repeat domain-containing protein n=1 Tax=Paenibacillus plantiphilus TaxID=2905650 RepID=A0ABN8GUI5_9BACL|nr:hypothetical protein [Paenibacillus plantiphilus]CAH1215305.1 hypothetical protein PAECIP111893_03917 [Paenibacillus plantiphilus]